MGWSQNSVDPSNPAVPSVGAKPGCWTSWSRHFCFGGRTIARLTALLAGIWLAFSVLALANAAENPKDLLNAGRVDQAIETLGQQICTAPIAEAFTLLCRASVDLAS